MKHLLTIIILLLTLVCCTTEADRNRMRAGLDSINVRNRNGQPFTVSDVQPYVVFFDENGTPNDRLLAHYLLGLAYYDHGEAPMALQCYQDAAECADTTAKDCDYAQLARVYGQMAQVFYSQGLYQEQLQKTMLSVKYAWKCRDTLLILRNLEQEFLAYKGLGNRDSAIWVIESHVSTLNFPILFLLNLLFVEVTDIQIDSSVDPVYTSARCVLPHLVSFLIGGGRCIFGYPSVMIR